MIEQEFGIVYDQDTGEEKGYEIKNKICRCDWSGERIDKKIEGYSCSLPYEKYRLMYGSQDPCTGVNEGEDKLKDYYIDPYTFLLHNGSYLIKWPYKGKAMKAFADKVHDNDTWAGYGFAEFLREMRSKTAIKLLEDGTVDPYQMVGFELDPEAFIEEEESA